MAWSFVAVGEGNYANAASPLSITKPSGTASGDTLVYLTFTTADNALSAPSGFSATQDVDNNTPGNEHRFRAGIKIAGGSEPSTYDFTHIGTIPRGGIILCYRGIDTGSPVDNSTSNDGGTGTTTNTISLTTGTANCLLIYACCCWNGRPYGTPGGSWTERYDNANVATHCADDLFQASAGSTGNLSSTQLSGGKSQILIAIKEAAGGGGGAIQQNFMLMGVGA